MFQAFGSGVGALLFGHLGRLRRGDRGTPPHWRWTAFVLGHGFVGLEGQEAIASGSLCGTGACSGSTNCGVPVVAMACARSAIELEKAIDAPASNTSSMNLSISSESDQPHGAVSVARMPSRRLRAARR